MTGHLSEEKFVECKEAFNLFDKDKDGSISTVELRDIMEALGAHPTERELAEVVNRLDTNKNGKVEFDEFVMLFEQNVRNPGVEENLIDAFRMFDKDGNGKINAKEFKEAMTSFGDKLTEDEAEEMISQADLNRDGTIDYKEFVKFMTKK
jgi:calmodulin